MKKKNRIKFNSRLDAIAAISEVQEQVPSHLSKTSRQDIEEWHRILDSALDFLARLKVPSQNLCAKKLKLKMKEELNRRNMAR